MIEVNVAYDSIRGGVKLRIRGHAGAAPKGQDLVCAAVSALALTAGQSVVLLHSQGLLKRPPMVRLGEGDALVIATPREGFLDEALMCFWTVQAGIFALQQKYPNYIRLTGVLKV